MHRDGQGIGVEKDLTESEATQAMWAHYQEHKALYVPDLQKHRDKIVGQLMQGVSVRRAFHQHLLRADPKPVRSRAQRGPADAKPIKGARAPWPF